MNSLEATTFVIEALEDLNLPYMLVGAFSSNAYGIPPRRVSEPRFD